MQHNVVCITHLEGCCTMLNCAKGVTFVTQHFVVAELCWRKAERLTHLIMYTSLYNIM
jgi:hypothetical protein